jgi:hypothetical protein
MNLTEQDRLTTRCVLLHESAWNPEALSEEPQHCLRTRVVTAVVLVREQIAETSAAVSKPSLVTQVERTNFR